MLEKHSARKFALSLAQIIPVQISGAQDRRRINRHDGAAKSNTAPGQRPKNEAVSLHLRRAAERRDHGSTG